MDLSDQLRFILPKPPNSKFYCSVIKSGDPSELITLSIADCRPSSEELLGIWHEHGRSADLTTRWTSTFGADKYWLVL